MLIAGSDPEYSTRDLYNAIARGDFPKWNMKIQAKNFFQARHLFDHEKSRIFFVTIIENKISNFP